MSSTNLRTSEYTMMMTMSRSYQIIVHVLVLTAFISTSSTTIPESKVLVVSSRPLKIMKSSIVNMHILCLTANCITQKVSIGTPFARNQHLKQTTPDRRNRHPPSFFSSSPTLKVQCTKTSLLRSNHNRPPIPPI
jgi:hypothetical protein